MARIKQKAAQYRWAEGRVDKTKEHIMIGYGDDHLSICLLCPGPDKTFIVQFLKQRNPAGPETKKMIDEVNRELDFYLVEKKEENPWAYARYHCGTSANVYSQVHWQWIPVQTYCPRCGKGAEKEMDPFAAKRQVFCPKCGAKYLVTGKLNGTCMNAACADIELKADKKSKALSPKKRKQVICGECRAEMKAYEKS